MAFFDILLISIGLSMDNMAVAAASSCGSKNYSFKISIKVAVSFCLTGLICLLLGFFGGTYLEKYISSWDHWASFLILVYIGGKMVLNFFKPSQVACYDLLKTKTLIGLALATNIDVFAISLTLAFYQTSLSLVLAILSICIIIFTLMGFFMGRKMGAIFGKKADLMGGIILIVIGTKILIQGFLSV